MYVVKITFNSYFSLVIFFFLYLGNHIEYYSFFWKNILNIPVLYITKFHNQRLKNLLEKQKKKNTQTRSLFFFFLKFPNSIILWVRNLLWLLMIVSNVSSVYLKGKSNNLALKICHFLSIELLNFYFFYQFHP